MKEIKDDKNRWRNIPVMDRKNQYSENEYTTQSNLQIQCNPYQVTNGIFHRSDKSLQSCPTLCNPIDGSPPGSPIPEFSRQEHWSELPFPSPMHESGK